MSPLNLVESLSSLPNLEHVAFATARVKQFYRVIAVDLFAQAIHIDLDRVGEGIEGVVPDVGRNLGAGDELARAAGQVLEQGVLFRRQLDFVVRPRDAMADRVDG